MYSEQLLNPLSCNTPHADFALCSGFVVLLENIATFHLQPFGKGVSNLIHKWLV